MSDRYSVQGNAAIFLFNEDIFDFTDMFKYTF